MPGCIPCKVYAEDTPILTIDSIVICQTHAEDLRRRLLKMHPGQYGMSKFCLHMVHFIYSHSIQNYYVTLKFKQGILGL